MPREILQRLYRRTCCRQPAERRASQAMEIDSAGFRLCVDTCPGQVSPQHLGYVIFSRHVRKGKCLIVFPCQKLLEVEDRVWPERELCILPVLSGVAAQPNGRWVFVEAEVPPLKRTQFLTPKRSFEGYSIEPIALVRRHAERLSAASCVFQ